VILCLEAGDAALGSSEDAPRQRQLGAHGARDLLQASTERVSRHGWRVSSRQAEMTKGNTKSRQRFNNKPVVKKSGVPIDGGRPTHGEATMWIIEFETREIADIGPRA
jgi:hypothetical protein